MKNIEVNKLKNTEQNEVHNKDHKPGQNINQDIEKSINQDAEKSVNQDAEKSINQDAEKSINQDAKINRNQDVDKNINLNVSSNIELNPAMNIGLNVKEKSENSIEQYVEELFKNYDLNEDSVAKAKAEAFHKLRVLYKDVSAEIPKETENQSTQVHGGEKREEKIMSLVMQRFGVKEAVRSMIIHQQLEMEYEEFNSGFEKKVKGGVFAILLIPLVFLLLMFTQDSKPVFLTLWIASILSIAAYLISLEYKKFEYEKRLEIRVIQKEHEIQKEKLKQEDPDQQDTKNE